MLSTLKNIVSTASSFLQSGVAPPNVDKLNEDRLANTNHLESKKFFAAFTGFIILGVFFAISIAILFALADKPAVVSYYVTMFTKTMEVFAAIMAVYIGGQAVVDLKYNSSSSTTIEDKHQKIDITTRVIGNEKEEDYELKDHED
jgi:hypothetical protein